MRKLIAIALIGCFSLLMVGTTYAAFDKKASIELKKDVEKVAHLDLFYTSEVIELSPISGFVVTLLQKDVLIHGYNPEIEPSTNDPPTIRKL